MDFLELSGACQLVSDFFFYHSVSYWTHSQPRSASIKIAPTVCSYALNNSRTDKPILIKFYIGEFHENCRAISIFI
jgi:hypothetical protein